MSVEPPGAHLRGGPAPVIVPGTAPPLWRAAIRSEDARVVAAVTAVVLALTARGDAFVLALVLGVAAADVWAATVATAGALAIVMRYATTSLTALAGAQTVLGPAILGGGLAAPGFAAVASALLLAGTEVTSAAAFGAFAGIVAMGPSGAAPSGLAVRALAAAVGAGAGVAVTVAVARRSWARTAKFVSVGLAVVGLALVAAA